MARARVKKYVTNRKVINNITYVLPPEAARPEEQKPDAPVEKPMPESEIKVRESLSAKTTTKTVLTCLITIVSCYLLAIGDYKVGGMSLALSLFHFPFITRWLLAKLGTFAVVMILIFNVLALSYVILF